MGERLSCKNIKEEEALDILRKTWPKLTEILAYCSKSLAESQTYEWSVSKEPLPLTVLNAQPVPIRTVKFEFRSDALAWRHRKLIAVGKTFPLSSAVSYVSEIHEIDDPSYCIDVKTVMAGLSLNGTVRILSFEHDNQIGEIVVYLQESDLIFTE